MQGPEAQHTAQSLQTHGVSNKLTGWQNPRRCEQCRWPALWFQKRCDRVLQVLLQEGGLESDLKGQRRNRWLEKILTDLEYKGVLGKITLEGENLATASSRSGTCSEQMQPMVRGWATGQL